MNMLILLIAAHFLFPNVKHINHCWAIHSETQRCGPLNTAHYARRGAPKENVPKHNMNQHRHTHTYLHVLQNICYTTSSVSVQSSMAKCKCTGPYE